MCFVQMFLRQHRNPQKYRTGPQVCLALPPPVILVKTHSAMSKLVSKEVSMATFFKLPLKED